MSTQPTNQTQQSISTQAARNLATTTKTVPQMVSITPRYLLKCLPWVQIGSGTYRVNRTKLVLKERTKIRVQFEGDRAAVTAQALRSVPLFREVDERALKAIAEALQTEAILEIGKTLTVQGEDARKFYIIAKGEVEAVSQGAHGEELRVKVFSVGDYLGEADFVGQTPSAFTIRTLTPSVFLTLDTTQLNAIFKKAPELQANFEAAIEKGLKVRAAVNEYGERHIGLASGHEGEPDLPETFIDYADDPREYELSVVQTILRVHTRVSDLYNDPINQLQQQLRLAIEGIKEKQEWELINNPQFGLLNAVDPAMRISARSGAPTPDDLDELLSLVWKQPTVFLAHPRAIAAFERECTWRGVPPTTVQMYGGSFITWRGVPLIPCDKLAVNDRTVFRFGPGTTNIILLRVGEKEQGVVGLHQPGLPGEVAPSLSVRLTGIDKKAIASYLLTLYFSCAVLTDDALAVLENVEVGFYHDYSTRK